MNNCIFCRIVAKEEKSWVIWENDTHIAFLTPFPNTIGFTVVATKEHIPSYIFDLDKERLDSLIAASKTVARLLDISLGTKRTAMIAEGMGIDHAHIKLVPLHGIPDGPWQPILSNTNLFYNSYPGFVSSHDGPRANETELDRIAAIIKKSQN